MIGICIIILDKLRTQKKIWFHRVIWHALADAPKNVGVRSEGEQITGHKLTLSCSTQSKPTPSFYEWKKIFNGESKTVGKSQTLHFHSLQTADSGQYVCIVNNIVGKAKSLPVNINVKRKYRLLFCSFFTHINVDKDASLACSLYCKYQIYLIFSVFSLLNAS